MDDAVVSMRVAGLETAVSRLERVNRLLMLAWLVTVAVVVAAVSTTWFKTPRVIAARSFVVRDGSGRTRMILGYRHGPFPEATNTGGGNVSSTSLVIYDDHNKPRVVLGASTGTSMLALNDGKGRMLLNAAVSGGEAAAGSGVIPGVLLLDPSTAMPGAILASGRGGKLFLNSEDGAPRVFLQAEGSRGRPVISVFEGERPHRLVFRVPAQ